MYRRYKEMVAAASIGPQRYDTIAEFNVDSKAEYIA